jgi:hypothetical protein
MIKNLFIILFAISISKGYCQTDTVGPTITILYPFQCNYSDSIKQDLFISTDYVKNEIFFYQKFEKTHLVSTTNWKTILDELQYHKEHFDIFMYAYLITEENFLHHYSANPFKIKIKISEDRCRGDLLQLQEFAIKNNSRFIVNFPKIEAYEKNDSSNISIKQKFINTNIQLYDSVTRKLLYEDSHIGDSGSNIVFLFNCENVFSFECAIKNSLMDLLQNTSSLVFRNCNNNISDEKIHIGSYQVK